MKTFTRIEPTSRFKVGGRFKRTVVVKRFRTDDELEHEFTTFNDNDRHGVAILALTPDNQVITSLQFRPGRERHLYELPGGGVNPGEDPEDAARRELLEESGYAPGELVALGSFSWDAYTNLTSYYFLATNCRPAERETVDALETEQGLETRLISINQLIDNAKNDAMSDAVAVLMAYDVLKERKGKVE